MLHYREWSRLSGRLSGCRRMLAGWLLGIAALSLSGCMDLETVVRVETDGSGTISDRIVMSNQVLEMLRGMSPDGQEPPLINEEELRAAAYTYGEGVTFLSAEGIETDTGKGFIAHYAFADINLIRVGQDPENKMPGRNRQATGALEEGNFTTFSMQPGRPASLTIHWPVDEHEQESSQEWENAGVSESNAAQSPEQQRMAMEIVKAAFKDMRMAMYVEVAGEVLETNATHLGGRRITLVDIAFGEFLQNEEVLKSMMANEQKTVADMKAVLALFPGLKLESEPEVSVVFE